MFPRNRHNTGMQTQWVADGNEVVDAVQRQPPELVLLDVMLPGRGGREVCQDLRERWDLPVLMRTALGDAEARVAGLEAGADDHVAKPFSPQRWSCRPQRFVTVFGVGYRYEFRDQWP